MSQNTRWELEETRELEDAKALDEAIIQEERILLEERIWLELDDVSKLDKLEIPELCWNSLEETDELLREVSHSVLKQLNKGKTKKAIQRFLFMKEM